MAEPRPWSNDEKNFLLAEIIKQQSPPPGVLFNVVSNINAQPRWEDMPLPAGRTLNSCRGAFEDMRRAPPPPPFMPSMMGLQTPLSAPPAGIKRLFQPDPFTVPAGREIRPKPFPAAGGAGQPATAEPPQKRKRGRPTKREAQEKAAAEAALRGEAGPAPPARPSPQTALTPVPVAAVPAAAPAAAPAVSAEEPRPALPALPATSRMEISTMLTMTPTAAQTASSSSSSSGKRRRGRSMRLDPEGLGGPVGAGSGYESPYGRAALVEQDTPARTAVMRHRDEQAPQYQQVPRSDPSEPGPGPGPL